MDDSPLDGPDAVYVHRGGAYTTEVRDADDEIGAFRVNPAREERIRLEAPNTGKVYLSNYLATVADETVGAVQAVATGEVTWGNSEATSGTGGQQNAVWGLAMALEAVAAAARRAADRAQAGELGRADESLRRVRDRLEPVQTRFSEAAEGIPDELQRAVGHRLEQSKRRSEQALAAEKL